MREKKTKISTYFLHTVYSFLGDATRKLKNNLSTYPWLWEIQRFQWFFLRSFFSKNCLRISPVRWSFFSCLRCSSSLVPLEDLMSKCCQIRHPGSRKIWSSDFFFSWNDSRRRNGAWNVLSPIIMEVNTFGPWMVVFCFHDCGKNSIQNQKKFAMTGYFRFLSMVTSTFVQSRGFLFFAGSRMNRMNSEEKSKNVIKKSPLVSMILEGCRHAWRFEWMI